MLWQIPRAFVTRWPTTHVPRHCNRAGHLANECRNVVCFNCEELGHLSRDCENDEHCCICKSTDHLARCCPFSWYQSPPVPRDARSSSHCDENVADSRDPADFNVIPSEDISDSDLLAATTQLSAAPSGDAQHCLFSWYQSLVAS